MMTTMTSIQALLNRILDYAGLFPPARLDMPQVVRNYGAYLMNEDTWMLGRLIVPVARLEEFEQHAGALLPRGDDDDPWMISALTAPAGDPRLVDDMAQIESFNELHSDSNNGLAIIDAIELKADTSAAIDAALDLLSPDVFPYFELPIAEDPRGLIAALVGGDAGAKVRTGGVTAELFPPADHLARFIVACATADVPFKATAGLHHPLRHDDEAIGVKAHGFLNVFIAACLAMSDELSENAVVELLNEESIDAFDISEAGIRWREHRIDAEQIEDVRETFAASFGSCSFDEPREDLRALKLL